MMQFTDRDDPESNEIAVDGTLKLCEDLQVDPEDVVMLAVAYELKSPRMGTWTKKGWMEGWKNLRHAYFISRYGRLIV
jgi:DCN1-like protein 1/2